MTGTPDMAVVLAVQAALVLLAFLFGATWPVLRNRNPFWATLGMGRTHPLFFIIAAVAVLFAGALCDEAASLLHMWKPDFFDVGAMGEISDTVAEAGPVEFVILTIALSLLPAVGEEVMFRGLVLGSFRRDMPAYFAVIYSSILFGLVHFSWLQGTAAGLLGCFLGAIVVFSGSIYPAMLAHLINNLSWCLLSRYESGFMDNVLTNGHSLPVIGISILVVTASVWAMWKLSRKRL
ncbi:MAG: CPBP family intramembrane metalloprotease [Deltaproteobacteria bacterium]|nr:CPBP family intramembrane metalloprotease [Deltaproteobacteria bacterium]